VLTFSVPALCQVDSLTTEVEIAADSSRLPNPRIALLLSVLPGAGQVYNQRPLKAILFAGVFSYYTVRFVDASQAYDPDVGDPVLHRNRNDEAWMMGLTWTLNLLDAFIDAQLADFRNYDIDDSVLPDSIAIKTRGVPASNE